MDSVQLIDWHIRPPDEEARAAARSRQDLLTKPTGALGRLEDLSVWLAGVSGACPPPPMRRPALAIFAGDHGVARTARTSAYPPEVTAQMVANFVAGGAGATVLARSRGVLVRVVDVSVDADWDMLGLPIPDEVARDRIRRGCGSIDREDAMTRDQALSAIRLGARIADELVDAGADLLIGGDMGIGNTTPAAVLVGLLTDAGPADVVGRGTGIDDLTWMRKAASVRDAMRRGRSLVEDPIGLLGAVTGPDLAAMTGYLLQASARGVPVLLDGIVSCACALLAERIAPGASAWWQAAHRSTEPAAVRALDELGLEPILDLGLRLGEGSGALVAVPVLTAAGDLLREMATFESAGVSDREAAPSSPSDAPDESDAPPSTTPSPDAGAVA
jgi:nicotinate-nucleotide--dimethylbenzimidazole phosphoribosyltransferase